MKGRLSAIQLVSTPDIEENLRQVASFLRDLPRAEQHLVVLPECFALFGCSDTQMKAFATSIPNHKVLDVLADLACELNLYLVAGTLPTRSEGDARYSATCVVIDPQGEFIASYNKMHLFDVEISDATGSYQESASTRPGEDAVTVSTSLGKVGLSVCYDLRFPELYRELRHQGAEILVAPSAFTQLTGEAHWLPLLQARAIENQCYMVAPNQGGEHANGRQTWGHSAIIDPWGKVLAASELGAGWISAAIDTQDLDQIRRKMPVWDHRRFTCEQID